MYSVDICKPCKDGTYVNATGATTCVNCAAGFTSSQAKDRCNPCEAGTYSAGTGSICQACSDSTQCPCMKDPGPCFAVSHLLL
jgi:syndecan 4